MTNVQIRRVGHSALMLDFPDTEGVEAWRAALWSRRGRDFTAQEIVTGARTVLIDGCPDPVGLGEKLRGWTPAGHAISAAGAADPQVTIPIRYDGEDLEWVASAIGWTVEGLVQRHLDAELRVAFCGFAPGFAYMTGLELSVPRLDTPRPSVPAGSVGLADSYCGIYPTSSPGGWRLIGHTDEVLFDPDRTAPALLTPGTRVRFERLQL